MSSSNLLIINYSLFIEKSFLAFIQVIACTSASGYRNYTTGALTNVGAHGDYWSSSPQAGSTNAGYLALFDTTVGPVWSNFRSYGLSVRCVQYLQAAFF